MTYLVIAATILIIVLKIREVVGKIKYGKSVLDSTLKTKDTLTEKFAEYNNLSNEEATKYQENMVKKAEEASETKADEKSQIQLSLGGAKTVLCIFALLLFLFSYIVAKPSIELFKKETSNLEYIEKNLNKDIKYVYGDVTSNDILAIGDIKINAALMIEKKIEMYQWYETSGSSTNSSEKKFKKKWDEKHHKPSFAVSVRHQNPKTKTNSIQIYSNSASINGLHIQKSVLQKISAKEAQLKELKGYSKKGKYFYEGSSHSPKIGDERLAIFFAPTGPYSIIAKQQGNSLSTYNTTAIIKEGNIKPQELISLHKKKMLINLLKDSGVGLLLAFLGVMFLIFAIKVKEARFDK